MSVTQLAAVEREVVSRVLFVLGCLLGRLRGRLRGGIGKSGYPQGSRRWRCVVGVETSRVALTVMGYWEHLKLDIRQ